jgi:hypothetical protein
MLGDPDLIGLPMVVKKYRQGKLSGTCKDQVMS